ncbi:tRNA pseudouridine(38-40) synthase TruA [Candidatus Palibaumannia cicadellinicola]|uniref:tRNA pseudouridine synthase A n=1 Tax=Candidatus Palibaumannia cicadellinicola TaxID=186490 RepID=A0A0K2BL24_9GAMM|nr:tRNA pseudouridine(38-40) synthase TruA [Candidatus Baumannia cicadellinicola]AKZ65904.1 tRNA pseudouridine synthase A [Candidatus Baumannia cicadellinicola]
MVNNSIRLALGIAYDGSTFYGWQRQQQVPSVQACLERALSLVAKEQVSVYCAGRTDVGVHATGQVVHFDTYSNRNEKAWTLGVNANLPKSIAVRWVMPVTKDFHARFSAIARSYRYIIYNNRLRPVIFNGGLTHYYKPLDVDKIERAGQCLLGEHDFTSFRGLQCKSSTPLRTIYKFSVKSKGPYIIIDITANAFLYHMVRNIVGSLIEVGSCKRQENWISEILELKNRSLAGITAQAKGLYLVYVYYPSNFAIPSLSGEPIVLTDSFSELMFE